MLTLTLPPSITAVCPHFGICGGCRFQTSPYSEQLIQKELFVKNLFEGMEGEWFPILACDPPWNYRNKMEFSFSMSRKGERFFGLMMRGSRGKVTDLTECHIAPSWMTCVLKSVRAWWDDSTLLAYHPYSDTGSLRTLTLRYGFRTGQKMALLTVSGRDGFQLNQKELEAFVHAVSEHGEIDSIVLRKHIVQKGQPSRFEEFVLKGADSIYEEMDTSLGRKLRFKIRPSSFFQPNTVQAERLYRRAIELAKITTHEIIFDLYCGTGTIGIFAATEGSRVIGIELNPDAVKDAKDNIAFNQIPGAEIWQQDAGEALHVDIQPNTLFIDPPRPGLSPKAMRHIIDLSPEKILYISCNPVTQSANIKEFLKEGYTPYAFQPVDQFPHTQHVENIVALRRVF